MGIRQAALESGPSRSVDQCTFVMIPENLKSPITAQAVWFGQVRRRWSKSHVMRSCRKELFAERFGGVAPATTTRKMASKQPPDPQTGESQSNAPDVAEAGAGEDAKVEDLAEEGIGAGNEAEIPTDKEPAPAQNQAEIKDEIPLKSDQDAVPPSEKKHARSSSGPLQAFVSTANDLAAKINLDPIMEVAKSVETAAKDFAGRIDLEPVKNLAESAAKSVESAAKSVETAAKDFAGKIDLEPVKKAAASAAQTVETAANAMDKAQRDLAKKLNIEPMEFAPFHVPMERRRQTFSVAVWALIAPISWFLILYCTLLTSSNFIRLLFFAYCVWIFLDESPFNGGHPQSWLRKSVLWTWFADYFPARLIKTVDLDPKKNYLFGYHPHGVLGFGAFATFATDGLGFEEAFPGIKPHLATLNINFRTPFGREWLMGHGIISADKKSLLNVWRKGPGESVALVIGGAEEAVMTKPGTADLVLNKRLGFVKLALAEGASIVPCFAFGENELFEVITNPTMDRISGLIKTYFGFTTPLVHGRGVFSYNYGILPRRKPITIVVGEPIDTPRTANPSEELVLDYHKQYTDGLKRIYDEWKERLSPQRRQSLRFIK